jgi:hypothetical protein
MLRNTSHRLSFLCVFFYLFVHSFTHLVRFYARPLHCVELDYGVMTHGAGDNFYVWVKRTSPYYLSTDTRVKQFSSLLAACFWVGVARNGRTLSVVLFPLISPISRKFVPSHSNRAITFRNMLVFYSERLLVPQVGVPHFSAVRHWIDPWSRLVWCSSPQFLGNTVKECNSVVWFHFNHGGVQLNACSSHSTYHYA